MKATTLEQHRPLAAAQTGYSDDTDARIRAFLASMEPLVDDLEDTEEYDRGCALIQQIAACSQDTDEPDIILSLAQCERILGLLTKMQPREKRDWWIDPQDAPSHVAGYHIILLTIEKSISAILDRETSSQ